MPLDSSAPTVDGNVDESENTSLCQAYDSSAAASPAADSDLQPRPKRIRQENESLIPLLRMSEAERAAEKVLSILRSSRGDKENELLSALSFSSYDIRFLDELAALLKVALSEELNYHRRINRARVLKLLFRNLLSKK